MTTELDFKKQFEETLKQEKLEHENRQLRELADKTLKDTFYDGKTFNSVRFAKHLIDSYPSQSFITVVNDQGGDVIWRYNENTGIYENTGIPFAERAVLEIIGEKTTSEMYSQCVKHLKVSTYTPPEEFEEDPYAVVLKNGVYNIKYGALEPFSPINRAKGRLPINYNPEAKCPTFLSFLDRLFKTPEHITFIQEWFGYHLLKDHRYQRTVILQGEGDNGKTTLLNVLTAFAGPENVSQQSLLRLTTNRFATAELYGKTANIAADIGAEELKYTGIVKTLTGNDIVPAERKNRDGFSFRNYAKLTFSCNQLPKTPDTSLAFYKRFIVLVTGAPLPAEEQDSELTYKLTAPEELSGIFNWALEGLQRALKNGRLSEPTDIETRKELYKNMSDPATGFINAHIVEELDTYIEKAECFRVFCKYCDQNGFIASSDTMLYKAMKKNLYYKETQKKINGIPGVRVFMGLNYTGLTAITGLTGFFTYPRENNESDLTEKPVKPVKPVNSSSLSDYASKVESPVNVDPEEDGLVDPVVEAELYGRVRGAAASFFARMGGCQALHEEYGAHLGRLFPGVVGFRGILLADPGGRWRARDAWSLVYTGEVG